MRGKLVSASSVTLSRVMHSNDASFMGTVHGGVILRMLDEAGGMAAFRHARRPVVTTAIDRMSFLAPVYVGNLVTAKASVNSVGKTSMEVGVRGVRGRGSAGNAPPSVAPCSFDGRGAAAHDGGRAAAQGSRRTPDGRSARSVGAPNNLPSGGLPTGRYPFNIDIMVQRR